MGEPPIWSTNEIEERYSDELLERVSSLFFSDDPASAEREGGSYYDMESRSETISHARGNAHALLYNVITRSEPFIEEDIFFIEFEKKIQNVGMEKDKSIATESRDLTVQSVGAFAVGLGGFWGEGVLYAGAIIGSIQLLAVLISSNWPPTRPRQKKVVELESAKSNHVRPLSTSRKSSIDSILSSSLWAATLTVALSGLIWGNGPLALGASFGGMFAMFSVPSLVSGLIRIRNRRKLLNEIESAMREYMDIEEISEVLAIEPRFLAGAWYLPNEPLLGFVEIPAGRFLMGSNPLHDEKAELGEQPQSHVQLPRYFIGRYPVTVAQYGWFAEQTKYDLTYRLGLLVADVDKQDHPVEGVSWHDATRYCEWLTEELKSSSKVSDPVRTLIKEEGWRVTLPSEAEWEKAARGEDGRIYPWGDYFGAGRYHSYSSQDYTFTTAVGSYPGGASPYGCLDMAGNVWQWTRSLGYTYPYVPNEGREDMSAPDWPERVLRGRSFSSYRLDPRCAYRGWVSPVHRELHVGFRVVLLP